jgi:hypothetical protein
MRYQQTDAKSWLINVLFESEPNLSNQMIPYREGITVTDESTDRTTVINMGKVRPASSPLHGKLVSFNILKVFKFKIFI